MASRIQDYGVIGDCRTAALVGRDGSLDWLCWPRFDSPSLFARLLDDRRGGWWRIAPVDARPLSRRYLGDTNVLVSELVGAGGVVELVDLMPVASEEERRRELGPEHELLRIARCTAGEVLLELELVPRPDYARSRVKLRDAGSQGVRLEYGRHLCTLRCSGPIRLLDGDRAVAAMRLRAGESFYASLCFSSEAPAVLPPLGAQAEERLARTVAWWRSWAGRCTYAGPYRDAVVRSVLALKLLVFSPSGAVVAAPTTSLPERLGGSLNWDYRFCWIRDAAFTIRALLGLGYLDEAMAFGSWLLHTTSLTRPELRVLYDLYGGTPSREQELWHLRGFAGSRPVRIRNSASTQLQLDAYGDVIDAVARLAEAGCGLDCATQRLLRDFGRFICDNWMLPDSGIWEGRGAPQHHTYSRLACWSGLDRLLRLHRAGVCAGLPLGRIAWERELIREDIERGAWRPDLDAYARLLGGDEMDATLLLMSWFGYAPPTAPRVRATVSRVVERLAPAPGLVYRYEQSLRDGEGAFGICSFWLAEHLALGGGSFAQARTSFEATLRYANDLGLFAEEIDPYSGEALGNFPQAFTHVGLIGAALRLEERAARDARVAAAPRPEAAAQLGSEP